MLREIYVFGEGKVPKDLKFIRVNADEVTYGLHIILRFELEKEIIEGKVQVNELPQIWNEKFEQLLGIVPPDDV